MNQDKKRILQKVADGIAHDSIISNELRINIYKVRVYLNELENFGCINQIKSGSLTQEDETHIVTAITPKGHLVLMDEITLDDIINKNTTQINQIFQSEIGIVKSGYFNEPDENYFNQVIEMESDYQYVMEQDRKRFSVLKAIYLDSKGDTDKATDTNYICQITGVCSEELLHILEFLENKTLIKPIGSLYSMYSGTACVQITHQGMCEVEEAIKKPNESTKNFPAQVFNTTFNAPVGGFQQGGERNIFNVIQELGSENFSLENQSIEKLQKLVDRLTTKTISELSKSQAYQAAAILTELKEFTEKKDKKGQLEAVSKWRQWFNGLGEKTQKALSIVADCVSLGLPLAKLLGFPVP